MKLCNQRYISVDIFEKHCKIAQESIQMGGIQKDLLNKYN